MDILDISGKYLLLSCLAEQNTSDWVFEKKSRLFNRFLCFLPSSLNNCDTAFRITLNTYQELIYCGTRFTSKIITRKSKRGNCFTCVYNFSSFARYSFSRYDRLHFRGNCFEITFLDDLNTVEYSDMESRNFVFNEKEISGIRKQIRINGK